MRYLDLMERALEAYSIEHIDRYFADVKKAGLTEHGFARLTANIGTMLSFGRKAELESRFIEMMDFCCAHVSVDRAANDFSIQEMIVCIDLLDESGAIAKERLDEWRTLLKKRVIYNEVARSADQLAYNWVLFSCVSEFLRMKRGLCPLDMEFIDMQLATQVVHLDTNGMYRDAAIHPPMVYDNVPRTLFSILLFYGYDGKYRELIDETLRRAGLLNLKIQSVTGEIPYGGRSNQFYHNEAHFACVAEYEARRYAKEGNVALAAQFKRVATDALASIERGLASEPIHHVKNRFPTESGYGCEDYAYFDKYMITVASFLNWARIFCDESIEPASPMTEACAFELSDDFHKLFLRSGDYFAELDTNADPHYDASGLGRIHKRGAPSEICLSCPGTATPSFKIDRDDAGDFAIAAGALVDRELVFKTSGEYKVLSKTCDGERAEATLSCEICGREIEFDVMLSSSSVSLCVRGDGKVAVLLPTFVFDGEEKSEIAVGDKTVEIKYKGYSCRYISSGEIVDTGRIGCNRNGHYALLSAVGDGRVEVDISIEKT